MKDTYHFKKYETLGDPNWIFVTLRRQGIVAGPATGF